MASDTPPLVAASLTWHVSAVGRLENKLVLIFNLFYFFCFVSFFKSTFVVYLSNSADVLSPTDAVCAAQRKPSIDVLPVLAIPAGEVPTHSPPAGFQPTGSSPVPNVTFV